MTHPGRKDLNVDVVIAPDADKETTEIDTELQKGTPGTPSGPEGKVPRPDHATRGTVRFEVTPDDAEVSVDGSPAGKASRFASEDLTLRGTQVHEIVLSSPGYEPKRIRVIAAPSVSKDHVVIKEKLKKAK
jgi:hypothetical protein